MREIDINRIARLIKAGLFVLPFLALIVGGSFWGKLLFPGAGELFFPFITGKNFFFRIIVEILFALWIFIAVFDRRFRPKMTPVLWGILATISMLTLSTIFSANPYRSFWSNYERMEGLIGHLHLFAYFLILTSVFLKEFDWKRFFFVSLGVSFIVSSYGYLQSLGVLRVFQSSERIDSTLGNSTYLAIYIVFHIFIALYFLFKEDKKLLKYCLSAVILYEIPIVFLTATRGSIFGLLGGGILLSIFFSLFSDNIKFKKISLGFIGLLLVGATTLWFLKDTTFVQENYVLRRFVNISSTEQTIKSRFSIWSISWEGFKERPILGWGIESYDQVFNKFYKPELWSDEPWFDRSHNVIFDWLIHTGILGLLSYLSIFAGAFYMLWKSFTKNEIAIFTTLFGAYFFGNIFVFDNLTSYFLFFSVLGFINFKYKNRGDKSVEKFVPVRSGSLHFIIPTLSLVFVLFSIYMANLKPLFASNAIIKTMRDFSSNGQDTDLILSDFEKVFSYNTFGTGEARQQMVQYINTALVSELPREDKIKIFERTVAELKKEVQANPNSARAYLMLGNIYGQVGFLDEALKTLEKALELSPKKQQIYFLVADIYLKKNDLKKAFDTVKIAYELDTTYNEAARNLAILAIINGKPDFAEDLLKKNFGRLIITDEQLLNAYARMGNWQKVRDIWLLFVNYEKDNIQHKISLAATYVKLGERQKAIEVIREAIKTSADFKEQGEMLIQEIQSGKNF